MALLGASGRTRISEIAKFSLETQVYQLASPVLFDFGFPKQHLKHLSRGLKLFVVDTCFKDNNRHHTKTNYLKFKVKTGPQTFAEISAKVWGPVFTVSP